MKPAESATLSEHLLREAQCFNFFPHRVYRTKVNLATQVWLERAIAKLVEWRKTFAPQANGSAEADQFWTSEVMLDQMYSRVLLQEVPNFVKRTQALRALTLSGISNAEYFVYLREAAHCYISGLPQAAIALSRAAVENRLKGVCAKTIIGRSAVDDHDLKALIDIAARHRILSKRGQELAHSVRKAGNDVLHDKPTNVEDALRVVEAARDIIQLLHGK
ncbi:MAG: DUF4145 domain-containing protein [Acidobacteriota bacterium]